MLDIRGHKLFDGDLVIRNSLGGELNYCIVVGDKTFTMKKDSTEYGDGYSVSYVSCTSGRNQLVKLSELTTEEEIIRAMLLKSLSEIKNPCFIDKLNIEKAKVLVSDEGAELWIKEDCMTE